MSDLRGRRVAVYARVSTDRQNPLSVEDQIADARRFVEARGGTVDDALVFSDLAVSGAVRRRPGSDALEKALRARRIDVLVVESLSRLSRHESDHARWRDLVPFCGARLLTISGAYDSDNETSELLGPMTGVMDVQYRKTIAKMTLRGLTGRARAGFAACAVPFGYRTVKTPHGGREASKIEIDDAAAEVVRSIFRSYADGRSQATIAAALNESGVTPPRERRERRSPGWRPTSVRNILRNAKYRGIWSFGATKWSRDPDTDRRRPQRREAALVEQIRPDLAIVDATLWSAVQTRRESVERTYSPSGTTTPRATRRAYPLSGVLVCGACGALLTVTGGEEGRRYYRCTNSTRGRCDVRRSHREDALRAALEAGLRRRVSDPIVRAQLEEAARRVALEADDTAGTRSRLDAEIAELRREVENLLAFAAKAGGDDDILAGMRARKQAIAVKQASRAELELAASPRPVLSLEEVLEGLDTLWTMPAEVARETLRGLLDGGKALVAFNDASGHWTVRGGLVPEALLGRETADIAGASKARSTPAISFEIPINRAA